MSEVQPIELEEFIRSTIESIENGVNLESRHINGPIELEVRVDRVEKAGAGVKAYVLEGGAHLSSSSVATVKLSVYPKESEDSKNQFTTTEKDWSFS